MAIIITPSEIRRMIIDVIPDAVVEVNDMTGTMDHFEITVISKVFQGKPLLEQHRMIFAILDKELKDRIHAVKIKTKVF